MLSDEEKQSIVHSWRLVLPIADTAAELFYRRLFELRPEYRALFSTDLTEQKRKLLRMLAFIVKALDWPEEAWRETIDPDEDLMLVTLALGRRHKNLYRVPDESYATVGEALLWTLDYGLGQAFTPELRGHWTKLYVLLARTMKMGAAAATNEDDIAARDRAAIVTEAALKAQQRRAGLDDLPDTTQVRRTNAGH